ncbi:Oidioi.mRNA.OKI2018_I69.chr2.g6516.t1.cds [Oikopleura dioica]|uniref:Oidioi.mRNA.OKI2018_I69.chr2.g6516.t1.cds n=1 Tax=Oikopleura dioica TaxID=34765 RepID=A0ABN7T762_OIKDI|nr:Oidioi.mRNA.OKI2018_I69.chr2.g6516.t1.cds [Oikopleura dioica]
MLFKEIYRLMNEGLLGRDLRGTLRLEDLRKPTQSTAVSVYMSAIQNLSISFENATVAPYTGNDPVMMEALFSDGHYYFSYIVSRMNMIFEKCRIQLKGDPKCFHLGDIIHPQKDRFNEILSHLVKLTQFFKLADEKIAEVANDFEEHKQQNEKDKRKVGEIEKQIAEIEKERSNREAEMKSLKNEIDEKQVEEQRIRDEYFEKNEENKRNQDEASLLRSNVANQNQEIQIFTREKKTLQELEVDDPEMWDRLFVEKAALIERLKSENAQLSAEIPRTHKTHTEELGIVDQLKIMSEALTAYVEKVKTKDECEATFKTAKRRRQELNQKQSNLRSDLNAQNAKCEKMHRKIVQNLDSAKNAQKILQSKLEKVNDEHHEYLSMKENLENELAQYSLEYEERKEFNQKSKAAHDEFMNELKFYADELSVVFQQVHKSRLNVMKKTFIS